MNYKYCRDTMHKKILTIVIQLLLCSILLSPICYSRILKTASMIERNPTISTGPDTGSLDLEPGDIAFKHPAVFPDRFPTLIAHCILYVGYNKLTGKYVFIEAGAYDGVQYRNETEENLTGEFYGPFARVRRATSIQKQNAIDFAKTQLGKKFQSEFLGIEADKNYDPTDRPDPFADEWYCSELVWAAYYNCDHSFPKEEPKEGYTYGEGIDIDRNEWKKTIFGHSLVRPKEILRNVFDIKTFILNEKNQRDIVEPFSIPLLFS